MTSPANIGVCLSYDRRTRRAAVTFWAICAKVHRMRLILAALLTLAMGFLPVGAARASITLPSAQMATACHDMGMKHAPPAPGRQSCADHCLSQAGGPLIVASETQPSLQNAISAELTSRHDNGNARTAEPPDPPPPRI